ncbi:MAG: Smr/MutS family protein [Deltaproteobacteria bacterium]|jgi:DNA-nicking Smr family endonuclease|nr:Smr/MutS family protein [Deltaproteobacteria bacterium]
MKSRKFFLTYHSFQDLRSLLKSKALSLPEFSKIDFPAPEGELNPDVEEKLFSEAMVDVKPIPRKKEIEGFFPITAPAVKLPEDPQEKEDAETLLKLTNLVHYGTGFNILDTAEYIEGTGYNVHPEVARRLHRGNYSIQAHVDLHALKVNDAKEVFDKFLKWAVTTGKRGVLIIHGRGLSSSTGPVLKVKVIEWLRHGPWRKWVVAYASARLCDGGAGATYVLLRQRPVSKRMKKGKGKGSRLSTGPWI